MRQLLVAAVVFTFLLSSGLARAQVKVAVFDLDAAAGGQAVAAQLTQSMRRWVGSQQGMVAAPGRSLAEIKLVFGCSEQPVQAFHQCLAKVGLSLQADRIVIGKVRKRGAGFAVVLTLIDVQQPLRPRSLSETLAPNQVSGAVMEKVAASWFSTLFGIVAKGTLKVICNVPAATVKIGDQTVGECDAGGLSLSLDAGEHSVSVSKDGYATSTHVVTVRQAVTTELEVGLKVIEDARPGDPRLPAHKDLDPGAKDGVTPPRVDKPGDPTMKWKVLFFSTASVGAALLVASIFTGMKVKSLEKDKLDEIRRWIDLGNPAPDQRDACTNNAGNQALVNICNKGERMAVATNALIGVGAALVAGSAFFLYKAYFDRSAKEHSLLAPEALSPPSFVVTPEIWERGGGVSATLRF